MTVIRPNSISGVTSITAQGGDVNVFRADGTAGDLTINNIVGAAATFTGVLTYEDVTNIDSVGVITARSGIRIGATGANTLITGNGTGIGIGITTPTEELHIRAATPVIRLEDGDNARQSQIVGSDGNLRLDADNNNAIANTNIAFRTDGAERLRIGPVGQIGIAGANYGTAGQVLTSQGSGSAVQWATVSTTPFGGALDGLNFGGTETTYTSGGTTYKVHSFTSSGFFRVTAAISVDFLIVGGGGGTAAAELSYGATGGGGAGGMVEGTSITIPVGKHTVTVGQGGAASNAYNVAGSGGDSSFNYGTTVTAKGGGGSPDYATTGTAGGSGSGGSEPSGAAGASTQSSQNSGISGIAQFGNAGGAAAGYQSGAGGGGGAGGAGQARSAGGAGGSGRANSITGSSVTYAVGGNGGATGYVNGSPGTNGRGNGASGATSSHPNEGQGAAGGSGIIIIRYVFS